MLTTLEAMCQIPVDQKMKLNIVVPHESVRVVIVTKNSQVNIFDKLVGEEKSYIFNGFIMEKANSLLFYDVKEGDCIIAFNHKKYEGTQKIKELFEYSMDKNAISRKVSFTIDKSLQRELCRLDDLRKTKLEMKLKRKFIVKTKEPVFIRQHTTIPQAANSPSETPLPIFW